MHLVNLPHQHFVCYQEVGIFLEYLNSFTLHGSNIKINHLLDCICISKPSRCEQISRGRSVKLHSRAVQMQNHQCLAIQSESLFQSSETLDACCAKHEELGSKTPCRKTIKEKFSEKRQTDQEVKVCVQRYMNNEKKKKTFKMSASMFPAVIHPIYADMAHQKVLLLPFKASKLPVSPYQFIAHKEKYSLHA